jgi:hypothetical protein
MCTSLRAAGLQLHGELHFRICPAVLKAAAGRSDKTVLRPSERYAPAVALEKTLS